MGLPPTPTSSPLSPTAHTLVGLIASIALNWYTSCPSVPGWGMATTDQVLPFQCSE